MLIAKKIAQKRTKYLKVRKKRTEMDTKIPKIIPQKAHNCKNSYLFDKSSITICYILPKKQKCHTTIGGTVACFASLTVLPHTARTKPKYYTVTCCTIKAWYGISYGIPQGPIIPGLRGEAAIWSLVPMCTICTIFDICTVIWSIFPICTEDTLQGYSLLNRVDTII